MKKLPVIIISLVLVIGIAFFGGVQYGKGKNSQIPRAVFQGMQGANRTGINAGTGRVMGEIIGRDDQNITVKLSDGGSKIVFFSDSTTITKSTDGSVEDLKDGVNVIVSGKQNDNGSYTAETIQIPGQFALPGANAEQ